MSREFPDWVNPWKAAEGHRIYRGTIPLAKMERLAPLLDSAEGEARFVATFRLDELGLTTIRLDVRAALPLICQASLERFLLPVERVSQLAVIEHISEQEDLPGHYEPAWTESGQIVFRDLVQDELILSVPQVPRKPGTGSVLYHTDPETETEPGSEEQNNPFAGLADMLRGGRQDDETH
jgi:uncharacterized protein